MKRRRGWICRFGLVALICTFGVALTAPSIAAAGTVSVETLESGQTAVRFVADASAATSSVVTVDERACIFCGTGTAVSIRTAESLTLAAEATPRCFLRRGSDAICAIEY